MSPSREAKIWSGWTFGCELASGSVVPSSTGSPLVPGSTWIVMSWSPVRGRSRSEASGWISSAYLWSTCMVTMARPLSSSDPDTWPTLIPAMVTVCPCPGVTACAELNSALSSNLSSPMRGTQDGSRVVCDARMTPVVTSRQDDEDPDRHEVAQVLADRAPHGTASGLGGPSGGWPWPLMSGTACVWQGTSIRKGGFAPLAGTAAGGWRAAPRCCAPTARRS